MLSNGRARVLVGSRPWVFNVKALRFISRPGTQGKDTAEDNATAEERVTREDKATAQEKAPSEGKDTAEDNATVEERVTREDKATAQEKAPSEGKDTAEDNATAEERVTTEDNATAEEKAHAGSYLPETEITFKTIFAPLPRGVRVVTVKNHGSKMLKPFVLLPDLVNASA